MTEIDTESMPATGTKINLTACPGPILNPPGNGNYQNCASFPPLDPEIVTEGLAVVGNSSSTSRSVMVDDMAVLVPGGTMPDNVDNLTFSSFGLVAHCQPVVDCLDLLVDEDTEQSTLYCPSFNPPYNVSFFHLSGSDYSTIAMFNLTNNVVSSGFDGYSLDSVLNPYGARVTLYWSSITEGHTVLPAAKSPGWYQLLGGVIYVYMSTCNMTAYNVSLSYSTLNGDNTYVFADRPVLSNFNTSLTLFAALDLHYHLTLVDYLKYTLRTSLTLPT